MNLSNRNACRIIVEKPEAERPRGRSKHGLEDSIKMDHQELEDVDWIYLVQVWLSCGLL
jgi:hypothetical protein